MPNNRKTLEQLWELEKNATWSFIYKQTPKLLFWEFTQKSDPYILWQLGNSNVKEFRYYGPVIRTDENP